MSDGEAHPFLEKHIKNYFKFLLTYHQNAFTKVIRQKNGTMGAVGAILKCHHNGTFL